MTNDMQREFSSRNQLVTYVSEQFPAAAARDNWIAETVGGGQAAQKVLDKVNPIR